MFWRIFEDKSQNFMNFFYRYLRSKTIHSCKSYTKSFFSTLFVVFCFEITFKIVKMRSISAVDFFFIRIRQRWITVPFFSTIKTSISESDFQRSGTKSSMELEGLRTLQKFFAYFFIILYLDSWSMKYSKELKSPIHTFLWLWSF